MTHQEKASANNKLNETTKQPEADIYRFKGRIFMLFYKKKRNRFFFLNVPFSSEIFLCLTATRNASVVYTRWGKKECPTDTEIIHSGKMNFIFKTNY